MKKWLLVLGCTVIIATLAGCESLDRGVKSLGSEFGGGLNRTVVVKSQTGEILFQDEGKFDIEVSDQRVKYLKDGKLQIIYLGGSTAIVTEK